MITITETKTNDTTGRFYVTHGSDVVDFPYMNDMHHMEHSRDEALSAAMACAETRMRRS